MQTLEKRKTRKDQKAKTSPTRQEDIFIKISESSLQTPIIFAWKDHIITEWVLEWALLSYNLCNFIILAKQAKTSNMTVEPTAMLHGPY